jgi:hypothetical protein
MTKAKLIKKEKLDNQPRLLAISPVSKSSERLPVEIVREWIGQRQQSQPSARQAFAALFTNPESGKLI